MYDICIASCKLEDELQELKTEIFNTVDSCNIIQVAKDRRVSINRNECYEKSKSSTLIFIDDDITGLKPGWAKALVATLDMPECKAVTARLYKPDGSYGSMINFGLSLSGDGIRPSPDRAFPFCCVAVKRDTLEAIVKCEDLPDNKPFDNEYTSHEDTDICYAIRHVFIDAIFLVNNYVKITHMNEEKWRKRSPNSFEICKRRFRDKWGKQSIT